MKNTITARTWTALAATTLAMGGLGTIARADSILEERSILVHFEDLDTSTSGGAQRLYDRIESAAATVCSEPARWRNLALSARYASCLRTAVAAAIRKINRPLLTQYADCSGAARDVYACARFRRISSAFQDSSRRAAAQ
jgi:UrcA family protein